MHCVVSLGCILMLLFPVISLTDDLHAMSQETEESSYGPTKRTLRQTAADKVPWLSSLGTGPSELISSTSFRPSDEACEQGLTQPSLLPVQAWLGTRADRAPPLSLLG